MNSTTDDENNDLPGKGPEPTSAVPSLPDAETPASADVISTNPSPQVPDEYAKVLDASDPTPASLAKFDNPPFDSRRHHDEARSTIAFWLLGLLTGLLVAAALGFGGLFFTAGKPTFDELKSLVELILTPLLTLVSAATGFYFGSQKQEN
ncbi:hypothetical protein [Burkholderia diffusa]|uniref:hypothetical protein n=1 Tax=Burkholderia diffusa TaxID=488732 RepID=UPI00075517F8|nr:hypothetical protein [Burkholderia diffusa]KWF35824.1 hypothetical protein WL86_21315 [Burkholderia diffusa]